MKQLLLILSLILLNSICSNAQITNVYGRKHCTLNGEWAAIIDPYGQGRSKGIYKNKKNIKNTDLYEYSFDDGLRLNVPMDWNSQLQELKYYEGTVWYLREFDTPESKEDRLFIYFGAVNYKCNVYLNGEKIGEHEGGFTPFSFDITEKVKDKGNTLIVEVNNHRSKDAIPALNYDWWNYGGITRDVLLVSLPQTYIKDYFIRLSPENTDVICASLCISDEKSGIPIFVEIPELKVRERVITDSSGLAELRIKNKKIKYWSPENPYLYKVLVYTDDDYVEEYIGFRSIDVVGEDILLNGKPVFVKGISFHEEIPQRKGRAYSESDAFILLNEAKQLGANMIRLAHYPQNEYIARMAEKMGFLIWEEIPIWQNIDFTNDKTRLMAGKMIEEMILRDRNRCALSFWGIANETAISEARNKFLSYLKKCVTALDTTRLITAAFDLVRYSHKSNSFEMHDSFINELDVVSINKYMGWYNDWPKSPETLDWNVARGKPLIISEFGGEALYGRYGDKEIKSSWSEDYQSQLYIDNLKMFERIPNLRGISPWVLFDFRSPYRFHPMQGGEWNRKGLVSDKGLRKKAWYIMRDYYNKK